jgi:activator of 2-hydroxyglutaryl-CoA dehydratase
MEGATYIYDSVAIPKGAEVVMPQAQYIFHIGAKDPYFFNLKEIYKKKTIQEWRTGTKCGGGSGTLIEKQCRRLFEGDVANPELEDTAQAKDKNEKEHIRIRNRKKLQVRLEKMFHEAEHEAKKSKEPCEFLARCGVVIQSDLIHKQNEGATRQDNLAGLFMTVARNYIIDVLGARQFDGESDHQVAIATGGVFTNDLIRKNLQGFIGIEIIRPEQFHNIAAVGAALKGMESGCGYIFKLSDLEKVSALGRKKRKFAPPISDYLSKVNEESLSLTDDIPANTEVVLGIDGGSTTTKGALVEIKTGKLLDKLYIKTHGNPEESLKRVLKYLSRHKDKVIIKGVGATGSARKLYEKILVSKKKSKEIAEKISNSQIESLMKLHVTRLV